jgi:hypothetical protein
MSIDLTTRDRVKTFLSSGGTPPGDDLDGLIDNLIRFYSIRFEEELRRATEGAEYTEHLNVDEGQCVFTLAAYPVYEVVSVRLDLDRVWGEETEIDPLLYYISETRGLLEFDRGYVPPKGRGVLQVVYVGGMSDPSGTDPVSSFIDIYPDLAMAVDMQVAECVRRRDRMGATNTSFEGGGSTYEKALSLLPEVERTIAVHRRVLV